MSRTEQQNTCGCAVSPLRFERRSGAVIAMAARFSDEIDAMRAIPE